MDSGKGARRGADLGPTGTLSTGSTVERQRAPAERRRFVRRDSRRLTFISARRDVSGPQEHSSFQGPRPAVAGSAGPIFRARGAGRGRSARTGPLSRRPDGSPGERERAGPERDVLASGRAGRAADRDPGAGEGETGAKAAEPSATPDLREGTAALSSPAASGRRPRPEKEAGQRRGSAGPAPVISGVKSAPGRLLTTRVSAPTSPTAGAVLTMAQLTEGLTFDDVLLVPNHSDVMPGDARWAPASRRTCR